MKKIIHLIAIALFLVLQANVFANTVIVKGYIKDSSNHAIANKSVRIYSDSSNNACLLAHTTVTNANGYYTDTLTCNGDIRNLIIIVENCNGAKITNRPQVINTPNIVESNFIICTTQPGASIPPTNCHAAFSYTSAATGIKFNGHGSEASAGDSITSRVWSFGDSTPPLTGNNLDPTHAYTKPGIYTVCLSIRTKRGCESKYCNTVIFTPASNDCNVQLQIKSERVSAKKIRFSSGLSSTSPGDSIVQRTWKFGDNTSLDGNQVNPLKEYKDTGVYYVCVQVRTAKGCEKMFCLSVVVRDSIGGILPTPANCKTSFTYTIKDSTVRFNSEGSHAASDDDSIISRTWYYADNSTSVSLTGNVINPSYTYSKPGSYNVYLVIKTKKGCESKYSGTVVIRPGIVPADCKAYFNYTIKDSTIIFNSEDSHGSSSEDSIISRTWYYADSSKAVSLTGNVIKPSYKYSKPGSYHVYLVIKTKNGCESKYEGTVVIRPKIVPANCKAYFSYTIKDSTIIFDSEDSHASSSEGSIISRTWYYADSSTSVSLNGNVIKPSYKYSKPGSYRVYLVIKTKNGCESKFEDTVVIKPKPVPANCKAVFTFTTQNTSVKFNSAASAATSSEDSIISRYWLFGDSTAGFSGNNSIDPLHTYRKGGTYTVSLYIKTKAGCESKYTATVVIAPVNCTLQVQFNAERISGKKVQFNSRLSTAQGDSIIQRNWKFGDNTILSGNEISPVKEFPIQGVYNACLRVKTINGCEAQSCKQVVVQDSINLSPTVIDYVKVVSINPNPVVTRMVVTIWSRNNNVEAELSIFDIYGTGKLNIKKVLVQGNNVIEIPTESLYHGPYFFKVSTKNGRDTKAFYKL